MGGYAEYNLSRHRTTLQARVGMDSDAYRDSTRQVVRVLRDSSPTWSATASQYATTALDTSVSGTLRLRLETRYVAGSGDSWDRAVLGDARVRCAF